MKLDEGLIGSVLFVPHAFFSVLSHKERVVSFHFEVSSSSVASHPEVLSVPASSTISTTLLAVLPRTASPSHSVKPSLFGAARMGRTNANMSSPSRGSIQYLRDRHTQRNAEPAKLDDKYI